MTTEKKAPPYGASIELTILIDGDVWAEREAQGFTLSDLERELTHEISYTLTHGKDRKLVDGVDELHVRKYF